MLRASFVVVVLALSACNPAEKRCAQARDVMVETFEAKLQDALKTVTDPADARRLELEGRAEIEYTRARFVPACLELPPDAAACVERIPEFAKLEREKLAALAACPDDKDDSCRRNAIEKADAAMKDCQAHLGPLIVAVTKP